MRPSMYNKLFTKILDSSIWLAPDAARLVWLTFLAAMDEDGIVRFASVANVAHRARVSLESAIEAVRLLESPDEDSSDPDNEGRRIERVPGGWMILNAEKYRALVTRVAIREQTRERVRKHRAKTAGNALVTQANETVTPSETETETDTVSKAEKKEKKAGAVARLVDLPAFIDAEVWRAYIDLRRSKRAGLGFHALSLILKDLQVMTMSGFDANEVLKTSVKRGWVGVFEPKPDRPDGMTFKERDSANAAARVREMTGGLVSAKPATTRHNDALQEVFDAPRLLD